MFVSKVELERVEDGLANLKNDTAILGERFAAHTTVQKENTENQSKKMDEIISLIKENHHHIDNTSAKVAQDLTDRLTREYATIAQVTEKVTDMKNCVRNEFITKDTAKAKYNEVLKDIKGVRDVNTQSLTSVRREAWVALVVASSLFSLYIHFSEPIH